MTSHGMSRDVPQYPRTSTDKGGVTLYIVRHLTVGLKPVQKSDAVKISCQVIEPKYCCK
jgi:hypothetical protein